MLLTLVLLVAQVAPPTKPVLNGPTVGAVGVPIVLTVQGLEDKFTVQSTPSAAVIPARTLNGDTIIIFTPKGDGEYVITAGENLEHREWLDSLQKLLDSKAPLPSTMRAELIGLQNKTPLREATIKIMVGSPPPLAIQQPPTPLTILAIRSVSQEFLLEDLTQWADAHPSVPYYTFLNTSPEAVPYLSQVQGELPYIFVIRDRKLLFGGTYNTLLMERIRSTR